MKKHAKLYLMLFLIFSTLFTTVAYAGLSTRLSITSEAVFRVPADIRITGFSTGGLNGNSTNYTPRHSADTVTMGFNIAAGSTINYNVTVRNNGDIDQTIYEITTLSTNNPNVTCTTTGYNVKEVIGYRDSVTFGITCTSQTSESNVNIVLKFNYKKVYHITYNANGGTDAPEEQLKYENVDLELTDDEPTRTSYTFIGWNESSSATTAQFEPGDTYTLNSDKVFYAVWVRKDATFVSGTLFNVTIKQLANPSSSEITYQTADTNIISIQRYASIPSSSILSNAVVVSDSNTSDVPIYAWYDNGTIYYYTESINPYMNSDSSFMFNNLTNLTSINLTTIDTSRTINMQSLFNNCTSLTTLDLSKFDISSVTNTSSMMSNMSSLRQLRTPKVYPSSATITMPKLMINTVNNETTYTSLSNLSPTNTLLKAAYILTINPNGGSYNNNTSASVVTKSYDSTLNLETPIKEGYTFDKWTFSGTKYGDIANNVYSFSEGSDTIAANYTANTYTVTIDADGGTIPETAGWTNQIGNETSTKIVTYDDEYGTLPTPTREGYTFKGWYTKKTDGIEVKSTTKVTQAKDHTLVAIWQINSYTLTINPNGGKYEGSTSNKIVTQNYGTTYNLSVPKRTGYKFMGWTFSGTKYGLINNGVYTYKAGSDTIVAEWQRVMAENIEHQNNNLNCSDAQCVIDELYYMLY